MTDPRPTHTHIPRHTPKAGGAPLALAMLGGTAIGAAIGHTVLGFFAGLATGIAIGVAVWLRDRRRG